MAAEVYPPRGTRVYVGGLGESIKKEDLELEFEKYGNLNYIWVAFNPPGFAFIEFANILDAEAACDNLNGTEIMGSTLRVEIARSGARGRAGGRGGGFRGRSNGRALFPRWGGGGGGGGSRGVYLPERGGLRGGRGTRGIFRGGRGRYDDYGSGRGCYGSSCDYGRSSSRDCCECNASGRESGSSRYRCRSPVGRGSSRDCGSSDGSVGYGRSGDGY